MFLFRKKTKLTTTFLNTEIFYCTCSLMHYNNTFNRFYQSSTTPSQVEMKRFRWKARNIRHKYVNYILVLTWNTIWAKRNFCSAMKQKCFKKNINGNKNWVSNRYDRNPTNKIYLLIDTGDKWWAIWIIKVPDKHNSHRLKARNLHKWMTSKLYITYERNKRWKKPHRKNVSHLTEAQYSNEANWK